MKIAVAWDNGGIGEHFGHAEMFALYTYEGTDVTTCEKKLIECTGLHGHADMANLMRDNGVDAVIVGRMGPEAMAMLLSYGIVPVVGYEGDADTAADLLITGQLPTIEGAGGCSGGCGGGCGGCGGCHGGEEGEEGGCGGCGGGCGCGATK